MKVFRILFSTFLFIFLVYLFGYPFFVEISHLKRENPKITAMMKLRMKQWEEKGKTLRIHQIWVPLNQISPYLVKAVLIAEDDKFYKHEGFDFEAIKKSFRKNLREGKLKYGGSTISQQVAKNLFLNPSKNPIRKLQEAIITWRLEKTLSKGRILEIYLNIAEWGEGIFGIEAASRYYFVKPSSALSPWEAAYLAAVLPNPLKYSPVKPSSYIKRRASLIYFIMKKRGIIKEEFLEIEEKTQSFTETLESEAKVEIPEKSEKEQKIEEFKDSN